MTLYETLALYEKGQQAWNDWAQNMLDQLQVLIDAGEIIRPPAGLDMTEEVKNWHTAATADFHGHRFSNKASFRRFNFPGNAEFSDVTFESEADYSGAIFEHKVSFSDATFERKADFDNATFRYEASFSSATFEYDTSFDKATFEHDAKFDGASFQRSTIFSYVTFNNHYTYFHGTTFEGEVLFLEATFEGLAEFDLAQFNRYTLFYGVVFEKAASFKAVRSTSAFSLNRVTFWMVPDFEQAHFDEAPRLDHLIIEPRRTPSLSEVIAIIKGDFKSPLRRFKFLRQIPQKSFDSLGAYRRSLIDPDRHRPAHYWRSLKRLAGQAHDDAREQDFFRHEIIARRFIEDRPWQAVFWIGLMYQALSDFGRSTFRPLFWLSISTAIFAGFYLGAHLDDEQHNSGLSWYIERTEEVIGIGAAPVLNCIAGPGSPSTAALYLSIRKTLLLPAIGVGESLNTTYACLYGVDTARPQPKGQLIPPFRARTPESVAVLGVLQSLISAVLLFLLLLAIRNNFRIK